MLPSLLPVVAAAFALGILLGGSAGALGPLLPAAAASLALAAAAAALRLRLAAPHRPALEAMWEGLPPHLAAADLPEPAARRRAELLARTGDLAAGPPALLLRSLLIVAALAAGAAASRPAHERRAAADAWTPAARDVAFTWDAAILARREPPPEPDPRGAPAPRHVVLLLGDVRWQPAPPARASSLALPGRVLLRLELDAAPDGDPAAEALVAPLRPGEALRFRARLRRLGPSPVEAPRGLLGDGPAARAAVLWAATLPAAEALAPGADALRLPADSPARQRGLAPALRAWAARTRAVLADLFDRAAPGDPAAAPLLRAMVAGDTASLPDALRADFARTGMAHLLAVSGLHASLLALVLYLLARLLGLAPRPTALLLTAVLVLYPVVTGGQAPILRAAVMTAAVLLPWAWGRRVPTANALALAALVLLGAEPALLFAPSFQLSFLAVAAIVVVVPRLDAAWTPPLVTHRGRVRFAATWALRRLIVQPAWVVLAVGVALAPALAAETRTIPLLGQAGNLLAVPWAGVTVALGFVAALLAPVLDPLALDVARAAAWCAGGLARFVGAAAAIPGASLVADAPPAAAVVAFYALLFAPWRTPLRPELPWTVARARAALLLRLGAAVVLLVWTTPSAPPRPPDGAAEVVFLDVGQGAATFLRLPSGATVLIDGGPAHPDAGRDVILPFLAREGIRHLDAVIATHGDADHIGGLVAVLDAVPVDLLLTNGDARDTRIFARYEQAARRARRRLAVARGVVLEDRAAAARLFVLHPGEPAPPPAPAGEAGEHGLAIEGEAAGADTADDAAWLVPLAAEGRAPAAAAAPAVAAVDARPPAWSFNDRSLVLLLDLGDSELLLPGDAGAAVERELVARGWLGDLDVLLAAHHGARSSTGPELLELARPELVVLSCGRGNPHGHPAPELIARCAALGAATWRTDERGTLRLLLTPSGPRLPPPR